jgi:ATP-binding cassette subfamily C protein CydC
MLLTLFILPPLFYQAGKSTGQSLTHLRGQYRQQLTSWLQGQAELTIFGASERYRAQMEATELQWHEAQRRQSELTALSQAVMLLVGALAVVVMLWMASGGVGGNTQPGALIALFVFCALAAFEALAPVTGAFQHLGQVIASALRITELTEQQPEVTFPDAGSRFLSRSLSRYAMYHSAIRDKHKKRSTPFPCRLSPVSILRFSVAPAAVSQRYCNC